MATKIQIRRDTAAQWTSVNPTLAAGEQGFETDTGKRKTGDGSTAWTGLAYDPFRSEVNGLAAADTALGTRTSALESGSGAAEGQALVRHGGAVVGETLPRVNIPDLAKANPWGVRLRGLAIPSQPYPATAANSKYWSSSFNLTTTRQELDNALSIGANAVKFYGSSWEVQAGGTTRAAYLANWALALTEARNRGLYVYVSMEEYDALKINSATPNLANTQAELVALAKLLDTYPNVVGIDIFNEQNQGSKDWTWVVPTLPLIRAVTSKPLTADYVSTTTNPPIVTDTKLDDIGANCDFVDIHIYYGGGGNRDGGARRMAATDFDLIRAAYGKPMILGETASWDNSGSDSLHEANGKTVDAARDVLELRSDMAGVFFWPLHDYGQNADAVNLGNGFFAAGATTEFTGASRPFRTLPRRRRPSIQSFPLVSPAGAVALTTVPTAVPNAKFPLETARYTAGDGQPSYRVSALVGGGVLASDLLNLILVDLDTANKYTADSSALHAARGNVVGGVTNPAGKAGFSNALAFDAALGTGSRVEFPPFNLPNGPFTIECWFKRTRSGTGVAEDLLGRYTQGDAGGTARRSQGVLNINASDKPAFSHYTSSSAVVSAPATSVTVTDTNWHHIAAVRSGGQIFVMLDGVLVSALVTSSAVFQPTNAETPWQLGVMQDMQRAFIGQLDEARVSDIARYASTGFTPSAVPFTDDANTLLLVHGDSLPTGYGPLAVGSDVIPVGVTANATKRVSTPWQSVPTGPVNAQLQVQNATAARGSVLSAALEVRYA